MGSGDLQSTHGEGAERDNESEQGSKAGGKRNGGFRVRTGRTRTFARVQLGRRCRAQICHSGLACAHLIATNLEDARSGICMAGVQVPPPLPFSPIDSENAQKTEKLTGAY